MPTFDYELSSEFIDPDAEALVLRALGAQLEMALGWSHQLKEDHFAQHRDVFQFWLENKRIASEFEGRIVGEIPSEEIFVKAIQRLADFAKRRELACLQEDLAHVLFDEDRSASEALALLEERVKQLNASPSASVKVNCGSSLGREVLEWAEKRLEIRRATGKPVMGISTGLTKLDQMLNGWFPGLHVVAAGPGVGKTTLCLQFAWQAAAEGFPVMYVSYENAARNLLLKLLCARAGLSPGDVERGFGDTDRLRKVWQENEAILGNIHIIEGDGRLRLSSVEAALREVGGSRPGLVVFDYLQRAAHSLGYEQLRQNVSLLTGELRDLSMRLDCPLIAISSQNRAAGDYGKGGSGALDSLKESGDLEYGADTVSLLYSATDSVAAPPARELELKVAKNRFGATGAFRLIFRPDTGIFREKL